MASKLRVNSILPVDGAPAGGGGGIIQVVSSTINNQPSQDNLVNTSDWTGHGLSVTITPKFSTSKMLVTVHVFANCEDASVLRLMFDSTAVGNGNSADTGGANNQGFAMVRQDDGNLGSGYGIQLLHTPGDTSSHTYKVQGRASNSSFALGINRRIDNQNYSLSSSISVMEVSA